MIKNDKKETKNININEYKKNKEKEAKKAYEYNKTHLEEIQNKTDYDKIFDKYSQL